MNYIVYQSLILSSVIQLEPLIEELDSWIAENFSNDEGSFYIAHTLLSIGTQIEDEPNLDSIKKYFEKFSKKYFDEKYVDFMSAAMTASFVNRCGSYRFSAELIAEGISLWEDALNKYTPTEGEYSDIDYIYDLVRINFLRTCYSNISNYTQKVREISIALIKNKDKFEAFEQKYRMILNS